MHTRILQALATYHYLTIPQFVRLFHPQLKTEPERRRKYNYVYEKVKELVGSEVDAIQFYRHHHPNIYFLTRRGAAVVAELRHEEEIFYPQKVKKDVALRSDSEHKSALIDCRVSLDLHAAKDGASVMFFDPYYRCTGANHSSARERLKKFTRIDFRTPEQQEQAGKKILIPDAIFRLDTAKGTLLCALEVQMQHDTGESVKKLELHLTAVEHGLVAEKYGLKQVSHTLFVFRTENALQAFLKRLQTRDDLEDYARYIACSTVARLQANFQDWRYVHQGKEYAGGLY